MINESIDNLYINLSRSNVQYDLVYIRKLFYLFIYLQTSPRTIWQERSHRTIVPITRLLNIQKKQQQQQQQQ